LLLAGWSLLGDPIPPATTAALPIDSNRRAVLADRRLRIVVLDHLPNLSGALAERLQSGSGLLSCERLLPC
jgi:hypothetical protein